MRKALALAGALLLAACAADRPPPPDAAIFAPGKELTLPRPADLGRRVEAAQAITVRHGEQQFGLEGYVSVTPERFLLAGLDGMGRRALTVTWTDQGVTTETAPWVPQGLHPGSMLADIVMLYWPEAVVNRALAAAGGRLIAGPGTRDVYVGDRHILHADYDFSPDGRWTGRLRYTNFAWGFSLDVQTREQGE